MDRNRKILNSFLILLAIIAGGVAVWIFRLPPLVLSPAEDEFSFGVFENRQLVQKTFASGSRSYVVQDSAGKFLFNIPMNDCILDYRYREGKLFFKENSGRSGYFDAYGIIKFEQNESEDILRNSDLLTIDSTPAPSSLSTSVDNKEHLTTTDFEEADLSQMTLHHPFAKEAKVILSGRLSDADSVSRRRILNYCEHLRTAYTTRDIDFIRQVFSDDALIIVGHTVKVDKSSKTASLQSNSPKKVTYSIRSKQEYINKLSKVFAKNKEIALEFSNFKIMRHPTMEGIYGVTLNQKYKSDKYSDDGYLFLLWDFRNKSLPVIHVRTWQPSININDEEDIIGIRDFNLE